jgi:quinol monooxygenase YgiN
VIHLVVTMQIREGAMAAFLDLARDLAPVVQRELGCAEYEFTTDVQSFITTQEPVQKNRVTLLEEWESLDALQAHLATPHMKAAGPKMAALRESVSIRVMRSI